MKFSASIGPVISEEMFEECARRTQQGMEPAYTISSPMSQAKKAQVSS